MRRRLVNAGDFGRVAVLHGGDTSEREVSLVSGATVLASLQRHGVDAFAVDGLPRLIACIHAGEVDRVFNILHGGAGENGVVQGALQAMGMPVTGTGLLGAALSMDKLRSKRVWMALDLPTPAYRVHTGEDVEDLKHCLPAVVKPAREGSTVGISRVEHAEQLPAALETAAAHAGEVLVERLVRGVDLTVAVLDGEALPSVRILSESGFYDYAAKYQSDTTRYECPAHSGEREAQLRQLALAACRALDVSGWARVDLIEDQAGGFWLLEVNTTPGMTDHSLVPIAAAEAGLPLDELIWHILETST